MRQAALHMHLHPVVLTEIKENDDDHEWRRATMEMSHLQGLSETVIHHTVVLAEAEVRVMLIEDELTELKQKLEGFPEFSQQHAASSGGWVVPTYANEEEVDKVEEWKQPPDDFTQVW